MKKKKLAYLSALLMAVPLVVAGAFTTPASAATGKCGDYAPDQMSVLLCNLGLKAKPANTDVPPVKYGTCADYAPDQSSVFLCNLGLKAKPPAPEVPAPVEPEPTVPEPTTPAPVEPEPTTECGPVLLKSDGTQWECTFSDEFNGTELDRSKWVPQTNFSSGNKNFYSCYIDDPAVVSQSNGTLKLSTRKMPNKVECPKALANNYYASGQISTFYKFSQAHGRFEARMKSPVIDKTSLQEAFWLWPDVRTESIWPITGEIDIMETYSEYPNLGIPFLHYNASGPTAYNGSNSGVANTAWNCAANRGEWNTYAIEWDSNKLEIFINGDLCMRNTSKNPALNKKYIVALTSALGIPANSYADLDKGPQTTEVDYIRAWK